MLLEIHNAIQTLLYNRDDSPPDTRELRIPAGAVDIRFEMPAREWVDSLVRPTINFFLFDIQENTDLRQTSMETLRGNNGMALRRLPPRRFDMHYMVSVLTSEAADEYLLLWRILAILLKYSPLPAAVLPGMVVGTLLKYSPFPAAPLTTDIEALLQEDALLPLEVLNAPLKEMLLQDVDCPPQVKRQAIERKSVSDYLDSHMLPLATSLGKADGSPRALDLWGGLEIPPRPALFYIVTVPVDLDIAFETPMALGGATRFKRPSPEDEAAQRGLNQGQPVAAGEEFAINGTVRDRQGMPQANVAVTVAGRAIQTMTNDQGWFRLEKLRTGPLTLRLCPPGGALQQVDIVIPSDSYNITLD